MTREGEVGVECEGRGCGLIRVTVRLATLHRKTNREDVPDPEPLTSLTNIVYTEIGYVVNFK